MQCDGHTTIEHMQQAALCWHWAVSDHTCLHSDTVALQAVLSHLLAPQHHRGRLGCPLNNMVYNVHPAWTTTCSTALYALGQLLAQHAHRTRTAAAVYANEQTWSSAHTKVHAVSMCHADHMLAHSATVAVKHAPLY